jgi:hypothetical protein
LAGSVTLKATASCEVTKDEIRFSSLKEKAGGK